VSYPLEPSAPEMREMIDAVGSYLVGFIEGLPEASAAPLEGGEELARAFDEPAPPGGPGDLGGLIDAVDRGVATSFNTTGPGYLAYIPGGGIFAAALADFLAAGVNRYVGMWQPSPALVQLEWNVLRWLADLFGFPPEARGIFTSGGSMANFSGIVAARHTGLGDDLSGGVLYLTAEAHASVAKAAGLAGLSSRNLRTVPSDGALRMDPEALRREIEADRARGLRPFCVVASAGTVNTGAVDPIAEIGEIAHEHRLWLHVDGAYGGFFQLTERGRRAFAGIEQADSIALDPHKGMFLPYGTGCLLVREGRHLRESHSVDGAVYLQDLAGEGESRNFADYSPELSRDFRGLRVWLPLKLHGLDAFREALEEKLQLARFLHERLADAPGLEVPWEPDLSIVAFRSAAGDEASRELLGRINDSKRVFLSSTVLGGRFTLRAAILCHRTHRDRIEEAAEIIRGAAG